MNLTLTVSTNKPSYFVGEIVKIYGTVKDENGSVVENATISIEIKNPFNNTIFLDIVYSSPKGTYNDSFKLPEDVVGKYSVFVTAYKVRYIIAINQTYFYVTGTTAADFTISVFPSLQSINPGLTAEYTILVTSLNSFNSPVALTAYTIPETDKINFEFDPATVTPTPEDAAQSTLFVETKEEISPGTYQIKIIGTYDGIEHLTTATLKVILQSSPYFEISATPSMLQINPGENAECIITIESYNGFSLPVTLAGFITPETDQLTFTFEPQLVTPPEDGSTESTLKISTSSNLACGEYIITIVAVGGEERRVTTVEIYVMPPIDWDGMLDRFSELKIIYKTHRKCFFNNSWWGALAQGLAEATLSYDIFKAATDELIDSWVKFLEAEPSFPISPLNHIKMLGELPKSLLIVYSMLLSMHLNFIDLTLLNSYGHHDIRRDLDNLLEDVDSVIEAITLHDAESLVDSLQQLKKTTEESFLGTKYFDDGFYLEALNVAFMEGSGITSRVRIYQGIRPHLVALREALILSYMEITYFLGNTEYLYEEKPEGYLTPRWNLPVVKSAYWEVNGEKVDVAEKNQDVVAHVILRPYNCSSIDYDKVEGSVTVVIKKDIRLWFDEEYAKGTYDIRVGPGETIDITLTFKPDEASGLLLRGYYIEVTYSGAYIYAQNAVSDRPIEWDDGSIGTMKNSYPPRLTVLERSGTVETSGTVIVLKESQHYLYLHIYDEKGRHTGINYKTGTIEKQIPGSQFHICEGINAAVIPSNLTNFKVVVDAKYAENVEESYNLTIVTMENFEIKEQTTITATIQKGANQQYSVKISPQKIPNIEPYSKTPLNWLILCIAGIAIFIGTIIAFKLKRKSRQDLSNSASYGQT